MSNSKKKTYEKISKGLEKESRKTYKSLSEKVRPEFVKMKEDDYANAVDKYLQYFQDSAYDAPDLTNQIAAKINSVQKRRRTYWWISAAAVPALAGLLYFGVFKNQKPGAETIVAYHDDSSLASVYDLEKVQPVPLKDESQMDVAAPQAEIKSAEKELANKPTPKPVKKSDLKAVERPNLSTLGMNSAGGLLNGEGGSVGAGAGGRLSRGFYHHPSRPHAPSLKPSSDRYNDPGENELIHTETQDTTTFSLDVDTASYTNVRRFIKEGRLPPSESVRLEEMVNYFDYAYPSPKGEHPFSIEVDHMPKPGDRSAKIVRIGLQTPAYTLTERPPMNLVYLIDSSGSMGGADRMDFLKKLLSSWVTHMGRKDTLSIVTYAGSAGLHLKASDGTMKKQILDAINRLSTGGSTNGSAGLSMAYDIAKKNFIAKGVNRIILASDGDFNVGVSSRDGVVGLAKSHATDKEKPIYISVLGFGRGNLNDAMLENLADNANGNYLYADSEIKPETFVERHLFKKLIPVLDDAKVQITFNPKVVQSYRQIGYANRQLANVDFTDDKKDAGEVGSGEQVTALYEIIPVGEKAQPGAHWLSIGMRYKLPGQAKSLPFKLSYKGEKANGKETAFAYAVARWGRALRMFGKQRLNELRNIEKSLSNLSFPKAYAAERKEFISLVKQSRQLSEKVDSNIDGEPAEVQYRDLGGSK